jgi:CO dehydrogenase/acetyl-CoA synthase gamma subunit (corrinoid Fe-S protein)
MDRNVEKLIKIEHPKEIPEMKLNTIEPFSTIPKLDLVNIEPYTEPGITVHVDLGLDQIEEPEE